jgi:hypothetical protein
MKRIAFYRGANFVWTALPVVVAVVCSAAAAAADRIVLRDLTILSDRTVVEFDPDGVRLDDDRVLGWDEIEKAKIDPQRQAEFDRLLGDLGNHLYRIRRRLTDGDYRGLLPHAEAVHEHYVNRESSTAYMVVQSLMWGRLAAGERERALAPYLWCLEHLRRQPADGQSLPGQRRLRFDRRTGMTPELLPVWFDHQAAREVLPEARQAAGRMRAPRLQGVYLYVATLALGAEDRAFADRVLKVADFSDPQMAELREIVRAQEAVVAGDSAAAVAQLTDNWQSISEANQPMAIFWLGRAKIASPSVESRSEGLLHLMRIAALYGAQYSELAGAALYYSWQTLTDMQDARGSVAVRRELLDRYGHTHFAAELRSPARRTDNVEEEP